ncbi:MAG: hypothetical protein OXE78_06275 [Gammaproteobacteria bacterium]|nr:hypothetical protein [Gammaproteobacteria bacterium]
MLQNAGLFLILAVLVGCEQSPPVFHASESPLRLSAWNLFDLSADSLNPAPQTQVFRPANQLFSDYAQKLRTLWIPNGTQASLVNDEIDYPVGTVISKTFYYHTDESGALIMSPESIDRSIALDNNRLLETRLLVRRNEGWKAFPYVWNEDQTEAFLRVAGSSQSLSLKSDIGNLDFVYFVPNENQCAGCHVTNHPDGELHPLGAIASQLTANIDYPAGNGTSQIDDLIARGWLNYSPEQATPVSWRDESAALEDRALAYLDMNCGHCHNPEGTADTSNLILDGNHGQLFSMGLCKPPVAAGGGTGKLRYGIVPGQPQQSILLYRMQSIAPDEMMPELGRSLPHSEGIDLVNQWIAQLPGSCE